MRKGLMFGRGYRPSRPHNHRKVAGTNHDHSWPVKYLRFSNFWFGPWYSLVGDEPLEHKKPQARQRKSVILLCSLHEAAWRKR